MNVGADRLSRGNPLYGEWALPPQVVNQLWEMFNRAAIDLFNENTHCPLLFSLVREGAPMSVDAPVHPWPNTLIYTFPTLSLIVPTLKRVSHTDRPKLTREIVADRDNAAPVRPALASPAVQRPPLTSA